MSQTRVADHRYDDRWRAELVQLANQLNWRDPEVKAGDYEVHIWHRQGLVKGSAQGVYMIQKKGTRVSLDRYSIRYSEKGRPKAKRYQSRTNVPSAVWTKLVDSHLLTLPTWQDVQTRYYASFPKDSTWTEVSPDGTILVKARRTRGRLAISDGEEYGFAVFGHNESRFYTYSNPSSYLKEYTDIPELRDVTRILNELDALF